MSKSKITQFVNDMQKTMVRHSPEILTGLGIAGMISTVVLAVKATPKALKLIEEEKQQESHELTTVEVVKVAWKPYVPAAISGVIATGCLIGACSVSARRTAALTTAYQLSTAALSEYKNKVVETIGEKKEQHIREKIDKDRVDQNPINQNSIILTKKGNTLCMDGFSKRYFESDIDELHKAINRLNAMLVKDGSCSLNDLYDELCLEHTDIGYDLGWNINKVGRGLIDLGTTATIASDGRPCIVVNCNPAPEWGFDQQY